MHWIISLLLTYVNSQCYRCGCSGHFCGNETNEIIEESWCSDNQQKCKLCDGVFCADQNDEIDIMTNENEFHLAVGFVIMMVAGVLLCL